MLSVNSVSLHLLLCCIPRSVCICFFLFDKPECLLPVFCHRVSVRLQNQCVFLLKILQMYLGECKEGPEGFRKSDDINKHCQMKLHRTICIWIWIPKLYWISFAHLGSQTVPWNPCLLEFFLWREVTCSVTSWYPALDSNGHTWLPTQSSRCLRLCLIESGLHNTDSLALTSLHWAIPLGSQFSVSLSFCHLEEVWGSCALDLFSIFGKHLFQN